MQHTQQLHKIANSTTPNKRTNLFRLPRDGQERITSAEKAVFVGQFVSPEGHHKQVARVGLGLCADLQSTPVCSVYDWNTTVLVLAGNKSHIFAVPSVHDVLGQDTSKQILHADIMQKI